jgi:hypothetical protein
MDIGEFIEEIEEMPEIVPEEWFEEEKEPV